MLYKFRKSFFLRWQQGLCMIREGDIKTKAGRVNELHPMNQELGPSNLFHNQAQYCATFSF